MTSWRTRSSGCSRASRDVSHSTKNAPTYSSWVTWGNTTRSPHTRFTSLFCRYCKSCWCYFQLRVDCQYYYGQGSRCGCSMTWPVGSSFISNSLCCDVTAVLQRFFLEIAHNSVLDSWKLELCYLHLLSLNPHSSLLSFRLLWSRRLPYFLLNLSKDEPVGFFWSFLPSRQQCCWSTEEICVLWWHKQILLHVVLPQYYDIMMSFQLLTLVSVWVVETMYSVVQSAVAHWTLICVY